MLVNDIILSKRSGCLRSDDSLIYESAGKYRIRETRMASSSSTMLPLAEHHNHVSFHPGVKARGPSILSDIHYLAEDRKVVAFRVPENLTRLSYEPEDEFYNLTLVEVKMLYRELQKNRKFLEDQPLMTKAQRDEIKKEKQARHTVTVIRVEFPDRTVLQAVFTPDEKVKDVIDLVSQYIRIPASFSLFIAPPKEILDPNKTLLECNLVPTGKLFYKLNEGEHPKSTAYLKEDVLRGLTSHEAACHAAALSRSRIPSVESMQSESTTSKDSDDSENVENDSSNKDDHPESGRIPSLYC